MPPFITVAVEGITDEAVADRILRTVGAEPARIYVTHGREKLKSRIHAYNEAARHVPWLILVDLNHAEACAPQLKSLWLPHPAPFLCFQVAVRSVESWLLADAVNLSRYLAVPVGRIPKDPEALEKPKQVLVSLARQSRRKDIRSDMVPEEGSGRDEGPAYASRLIEFIHQHWNVGQAATRSDSLRRALRCLQRLKERLPHACL